MALTVRPRIRLPWSVSFPAFINALSIPLIAGILVWLLVRVLKPSDWCPALEEFKLTGAATVVQLRCQAILLAQLDIAKYCSIGLVGALSLSHLVSVVREAKAGLDLVTKLGSLRIGGEGAVGGAEHVKEAAEEAAAEVEAAATSEAPAAPAPAPAPAAEPPTQDTGGVGPKGFSQPPGEEPL